MRAILIIPLLITLILFGFVVFAEAKPYQVPKDAVIKVYAASGKQIGEMNRSEYKVVKLGTSKPPIVNEVVKVVKRCDSVKQHKRHQSLILHAGPGKQGVKVRNNGTQFEVSERDRAVLGATLCTSEKGAGICASAHSNETYQIGIKVDFD